MIDLKEKVAVITGASQGIGREIAMAMSKAGAAIVAADINPEPLKGLVEEITSRDGRVLAVTANITKFEDCRNLMDSAVKEFGRIDVLVNNAGVTRDTLLIRMSEADWDLVLKVNLKGAFLMTQAVAKVMIKQHSGKIVNISSVVGLMGNAGQVNYSASKAGLLGLTKSVARELAGRGICVNAIAPGFIETDMTAKMSESVKTSFLESIPLKKAGMPNDIAKAALFLSSPASDYITGQVLGVNGGLYM